MISNKVLSAIELIRKKPEMFFESGRATMNELISMVVRDVAGLVKFKADLWCDGSLAMITADSDWMISDRASFEELFDRFVIPTPMRPNAHRSEVILAATCEGLLTFGEAGDFSFGLQEADLPVEMVDRAKSAARGLLWRFQPPE